MPSQEAKALVGRVLERSASIAIRRGILRLVAVRDAHARHRAVGHERDGLDEREVVQLEPSRERIASAKHGTERRRHDRLARERALDDAPIVRDVLRARRGAE
jgi:hypothetical protein